MKMKVFKTISVLLMTFLLASSLGACKKDEGTSSKSSAGKTSSTAKASSGTSSSKKTTTKGTAATKTGSSTNSTSGTGSQVSAGGNSEQPQGGNGSAPDQATVSGGQETGGMPVENVIDYGGKSIVVALRNAAPTEGTSAIGDIQYRSWKAAETKYNCKFEWKIIPGGTGAILESFVSEYLAGLHFADTILFSTKAAFPSLAEKGYIMPVDDYMDFSSPLYNTEYCRTSALWRGKHYGYGGYVSQASYGVFYNRDIFSQEGIEDLHSVANNGNWTWDKFVEIAQATTKDFNSDGVIDQWGISMSAPGHTANCLLASNGSAVLADVNGRITFTLDDPKAFKALQFMSDLCNVYKVATNGSKYTMFQQGISAMQIGTMYWEGGNFKNLSSVNYGFVYPPKGPDMQTYAKTSNDCNFYGFASTLQNPKEIITIMNDVQTIWDPSKPEHINKDEYLRVNALLAMKDPIDIEFGINEFVDPTVNIMPFSFADATKVVDKEVYNKIIAMETTPQAAVDAVKEQVQALIDASAGQ